MKSTITGWGKCTPDNIMTNDDLSKFVDTSDEWIQQRTGVKERRFSHVNTSDMADIAGKHVNLIYVPSPEGPSDTGLGSAASAASSAGVSSRW